MISELEEKYSILDALFNDLSRFKQLAAQEVARLPELDPEQIPELNITGSGHRGFVAAVQSRLEFLSFLLSNSTVKLSKQHIDVLWEALVVQSVCPAETELFFHWSKEACDYTNNSFFIFDNEVRHATEALSVSRH